MTTIYRGDTGRLTVAEAKRLIVEAMPLEPGFVSFSGVVDVEGSAHWDFDSPTPETFRETIKYRLNNSFLDLCRESGFEPHLSIDPSAKGYRLREEDDLYYMVTHAQFVKLAYHYSLTVEIGKAAEQASTQPKTALVVYVPTNKTAKNKRAKTLAFETEVVRLMTYFWDNRITGTNPTKGDLHSKVYNEMLRGIVHPPYATLNVGIVRDAAKTWRKPLVVPSYVPPAQSADKRHPFKGER